MAFSDIPQQTVDATLAAVGVKTAYTGATTSVVGWALSSEFGVLAGILIGVSGLLMQFYFNRRRDRREQAEHELRMVMRKDHL